MPIYTKDPVTGTYNRGIITDDIQDYAVTRTKLEYPTEDVSFAYLLSIGKAKHSEPLNVIAYPTAVTVDSFTDKAIAFVGIGARTSGHLRINGNDYYSCRKDTGTATADFQITKYVAGTLTSLTTEAVDLDPDNAEIIVFSISGSTLKAWRNVTITNIPTTTATLSATDTDIASGQIGASHGWYTSGQGTCGAETHIYAPFSHITPAKVIIQVELDEEGNPIFMKDLQPTKEYEILKAKGFTDEEIKLLFPNIKICIDKLSVSWGAFDHKQEHNTMLAIITGGNPYTGDDAILKQIEHAKSKNLKVVKPPKDYHDAIDKYKQLKKEFDGWIAGKDNFAYQTLGHEDFEAMQVADTYYGRIIDMGDTKAYKNVPDWEMRRVLNMWKERLKRAKVVREEANKHIKKLEEVERIGW